MRAQPLAPQPAPPVRLGSSDAASVFLTSRPLNPHAPAHTALHSSFRGWGAPMKRHRRRLHARPRMEKRRAANPSAASIATHWRPSQHPRPHTSRVHNTQLAPAAALLLLLLLLSRLVPLSRQVVADGVRQRLHAGLAPVQLPQQREEGVEGGVHRRHQPPHAHRLGLR